METSGNVQFKYFSQLFSETLAQLSCQLMERAIARKSRTNSCADFPTVETANFVANASVLHDANEMVPKIVATLLLIQRLPHKKHVQELLAEFLGVAKSDDEL